MTGTSAESERVFNFSLDPKLIATVADFVASLTTEGTISLPFLFFFERVVVPAKQAL